MNVVPLIPDTTALQESLAYLPLATYQPGETVLAAGSKTGRLLFLKDGSRRSCPAWHTDCQGD